MLIVFKGFAGYLHVLYGTADLADFVMVNLGASDPLSHGRIELVLGVEPYLSAECVLGQIQEPARIL